MSQMSFTSRISTSTRVAQPPDEPVTLFKQAHQNLMEGNGDRAAAIIRDLIQQETIYAIKYLPKFDTL